MNVTLLVPHLWSDAVSFSDGLFSPLGATRQSSEDDVTSSMITTPMTSQLDGELTLAERLLLLSKEQRARAEEILLIIRYVIFSVSLPATVCTVVVFLQPSMRSATSVHVIGLSLAQLLYILTNIVARIMATTIDNPLHNYVYLLYSVYISSYLSILVRRGSYLVMCYMSLERLYAVLRPLHVKQFLLTRYPLVITALTYLFSALWHVYSLVKTSIKKVWSSRTGKMVYTFRYTHMYKDNPQIADGFAVAAPILMTYIPLLVLMTLNVTTVWALRRHNTRRLQSTANEETKRQQERQMTVTILATTVIYVLLSLPYAFHNLFKSAFEEFDKRKKYENLYYVSRSCAFNLTLLSCALDFLCFLLLSSTFRSTFFTLIGLRRGKGGKPNIIPRSSASTTGTDVETKY